MAAADAYEYFYENVGIEKTVKSEAYEYLPQNVGIEKTVKPEAYEYLYEGDVSTNTPAPYIWGFFPTSGRGGDGFAILGHGFGDTQGTYSGVVEAQQANGTWTTVPVTGWSRVAATADAYGANREIDILTPFINTEYGQIDVTVPAWAKPPTLNFRVRTEGA